MNILKKNIKMWENKTSIQESMKGKIILRNQDKDIILQQDNHIVLCGRNYRMQRLCGIPYDINSDMETWVPRWFSLGNGGATSDSPFQPIWPADEDTDVYNHLKFVDTYSARYTVDCYKKLIDSVEYVSYTTVKFTMSIDPEDVANQYINEAGLFAAPSEASTTTDFVMISHSTFPSIPKSDFDSLILEWYYIF